MGLIRRLSLSFVFAVLALQGCSPDETAAVQELVTVEPRQVDFYDDFVVRVAMQQPDGLGVSIYKAGAAETEPALTAQPLKGTDAVRTVEFSTVRLRPGKYFAAVTDKAGKRLAGAEFSVVGPDGRPRLRVSPSSLVPGDPITVTLRRVADGELGWFGIYPSGEPNLAAYLARQDANALADQPTIFDSGDFAEALTPGRYEVRLMRADGYVELANAPFLVTDPNAKPELTLASDRVKVGDPITVSFKDAPGTEIDHIAIYKVDEPDKGRGLVQLRTGGKIAGQVVFTKERYRAKLPPGPYVAKLLAGEEAKVIASASFWMIDGSGVPQVAVARSRIKPGDALEISWTSAPANEGAWIGVFKSDDLDSNRVLAQHANAAVDGGVTLKAGDFPAALQPGEYKVRVMRQDRTTEVASVSFTVLDPSVGPQVTVATPVKSGDPIKVSWIGSPGNEKDWIGLYKADVTNTRTYIKWLYTRGAVDGVVSFNDSLPPGEYVARLLVDNGYEEFAASVPFTVTAP